MALPALKWKMLPPVVITSTAEPSFILDAIYTAGTATVYADGTGRVLGSYATPGLAGQTPTLPASGFAWTWNYDNTTKTSGGVKTACYAVPQSPGSAYQQIIFMGIPSAVAPGTTWKVLIDGRSAQYLYAGTAKGTGVYTTFDNATTPFTTGDFTGFTFASNLTTAAGITQLYMWECAEAVIIQLRNSAANGNMTCSVLGAFIDPLSANTANAETDGRLYGIATTGQSTLPATWMFSTAGGELFFHNASANTQHFVTFTPGAGTVTAVTRGQQFSPTPGLASRNGDYPQIPYQVVAHTGGAYIGQLRQMFVTRDSVSGIVWEAAGVQTGYLLAASTLTATDTMLLAV
jgi:hypothetical protein